MPAYLPARDLAVATAMVAELEPYLLSEELFWPLSGPPVPGGGGYPRLTFGGLLLALARLKAVEAGLPPDQQASLARASNILEATCARWPAAVDRKLDREIKSRLDLWAAFLQDCAENRTGCADNYPRQVTYRAMLALLLGEISVLPPDSPHPHRLASADSRLRARFTPGDFVWPSDLQPAFPPDRFWFLFGSVA